MQTAHFFLTASRWDTHTKVASATNKVSFDIFAITIITSYKCSQLEARMRELLRSLDRRKRFGCHFVGMAPLFILLINSSFGASALILPKVTVDIIEKSAINSEASPARWSDTWGQGYTVIEYRTDARNASPSDNVSPVITNNFQCYEGIQTCIIASTINV